jgi:hypothetical protein
MPIINRPKSPEPEAAEPAAPEPPPPPSVIPRRARPVESPRVTTSSPGVTRPIVFGVVALLLGVAVPFIVYGVQQLIPDTSAEVEDPEPAQGAASGNIELDLKQLHKLAGIVAVTQEQFANNKAMRELAQQTAEPNTLSAFDAILEANQRELADTRERMAQVLLALHAAYEQSPRQVGRQFESAIADAEKNGLGEVARLLKVGFDAVQQVPDGVPPGTYFAQAFTENS